MPVNTRIQLRRGTTAQWASSTDALSMGEVGFDTDLKKFKIGDGVTLWGSLDWASILPSELNELVDDRVNGLLVAGTGVALSYNDGANTLTINTNLTAGSGISISGATISLSDPVVDASDVNGLSEAVDDRVNDLLVAGSGIQLSYNDNANTLSIAVTGIALSGHTHTASEITDFSEAVDDRVNGLLSAGSNVQLTYNDGANSLTVAVTGVALSGHTHTASNITDFNTAVSGLLPVKDVVAGSGISVSSSSGSFTVSLSDPTIQAADVTDFSEAVDDRVSNLLVAGSGVSISYNDGSNTLTVSSSLTAGSGISVSESSGVYTVSLSDPTIQVADITDLTASASELNTLDGITASTSELNILDGVTADYTEINLLDGAIANTVVNSKAVVYGSSGQIAAASISTTGNVTVGGDLVVNGTTTTVNSTVTTLDDPVITLGGDTAPSSNDSKDRGVEFRWHNGTAAKVGFFGYDNSTGKFTFIPDATNSSEAFSGTTGELDAKVDWSNINSKPDPVIAVDITGDVVGSGNLTMTDLAGGTISISSVIQANSVALGTDTTGDYVASVSVSGTGLSVSGTGENASVTVTSNATSANTASTIVSRDSSGNFSAGTITADLSGTATNANNIEVDVSSSNTNHLVFVNGTDGNLKPSVNSNLRFDAVNNELLGDDSTTPTTKLKYFIIDGGTP